MGRRGVGGRGVGGRGVGVEPCRGHVVVVVRALASGPDGSLPAVGVAHAAELHQAQVCVATLLHNGAPRLLGRERVAQLQSQIGLAAAEEDVAERDRVAVTVTM